MPVAVEGEARLGVADLNRLALAGEREGQVARGGECVRVGLLGAGAAGEDLVDLAVGEAPVAAHARAVEGDAPHVGADQLHLDRDRELVLAGAQRAGLVGQHLRQHRLDGTGHIDARGAPQRLALEWAARAHVGGHVGDVHPEPHVAVLAARRDGVVEVPGVVGVDREGRQVGQVHAGVGRVGVLGRALGLRRGGARVAAAQPAVEHQPLEHVARDVRPPQPAHNARAALARAHQHQVALAGAAALDRRARPLAEQRLGDQEAAALLEHGDEWLVEAPGRAAADGCAHSLPARTSSATGSASSRLVFGLSKAFTCGLSPRVEIVSPPGR